MSDSITSLIAAKLASDDFKLPVFNQVALELQQALREDVDLKSIEKIILKDAALASEVLRVANSSFFAGLAKLQSIQQALVRLGMNRVMSVVMIATQKQAFKAKDPFITQVMKKLWEQAIASAGACRWVAVKYGYRNLAEPAFLAGLMHDLGSLVVLKVLDELTQSGQAADLTEAVILEVIDSLHTEYGYKVMQGWHLPPEYAVVARDHHLDGVDGQNVLLQIVRLIDAACSKVGIGLCSNPDLVLEGLPEAHLLGVKDVHLAELEIELEEMIEQFG